VELRHFRPQTLHHQKQPERGALVEPGPDVIDPVLVEHPKLKYPSEAKRDKVEAVVRVRVLVDENGAVLQAKVEKPVGHGLDEAATKVALEAKFIPATKGTVPVKMWTVLPLRYSLQ
jgi:TonB family protein